MFPVSVTYSACFGKVALVEIRHEIDCWIAASLRTKDIVSAVNRSGQGIEYIAGSSRKNQKADVKLSSRRYASSMKKGGQLELLALLSIVLSISWKEEEQKKLLTSSHSAFCWIDLLPPLYKSWSCSFLPVEVSCRGLFPASTMSNIRAFKRTMWQTIIFLQEKVEAASSFFKRFQRQVK